VKVLHVHRIGGIGGSERHLLTLLPALAERGVAATGLVEIRRTLPGWQFQRRVKDGLFPLVRFAHGMNCSAFTK